MQHGPDWNDITFIIPAYNEAPTIGRVVGELRSRYPTAPVMVVDDGSDDKTGELATGAGAQVIRHPRNLGNGAAVKTGLRQAQTGWVIMLDADGQHDPAQAAKFLPPMSANDMVVGVRAAVAHTSFLTRMGNGILSLLASILTGTRIPDLTSGFRAIRREAILRFIHLLPNEFSYPTTSTLAFIKEGLSVSFVPIEARQRESGAPRLRPWRDGFRFLIIIIRLAVLFEPLKVFMPVSLLMLLVGTASLIYDLIHLDITQISMLLLLGGIFLAVFGVLADQVAALRRSI